MSHGYEHRYVGFIDILGFSDLVDRSEKNDVFFEQLRAALSKVTLHREAWNSWQSDPPRPNTFRSHAFSDSVIVSEVREVGLTRLFVSITQLCFHLLGLGVLTRGAVACGKLFHDDAIAFGPALIEAYKLESTAAKYPRILVSDEVYQASQDEQSRFGSGEEKFANRTCEFLRRDVDRLYHLDYLRLIAACPQAVVGADCATLRPLLVRARQILEDSFITASRADVRAKVGWFVGYFNEFTKVTTRLPELYIEPISFPDDEMEPAVRSQEQTGR